MDCSVMEGLSYAEALDYDWIPCISDEDYYHCLRLNKYVHVILRMLNLRTGSLYRYYLWTAVVLVVGLRLVKRHALNLDGEIVWNIQNL